MKNPPITYILNYWGKYPDTPQPQNSALSFEKEEEARDFIAALSESDHIKLLSYTLVRIETVNLEN